MNLPEHNELLRSAYTIAKRQGVDTNWEAFETSVLRELLKEAGFDSNMAENVIKATVTPRTYRAYKE